MVFLKIEQNSQENRGARVTGPQTCNFIKKAILAQLFSCEFCETCKKTFLTEHLRVTASNS